MPKSRGNPKILAAGAAVQLLTGIPAAWGVFQAPVMSEYGFTRGQVMLCFAVLVAGYGVGCAVGGFVQDAHGPRTAALWGTALLSGGSFAAALLPPGSAAMFLALYSVPAGAGSAFLTPAVLTCAQKWYADRKGLATGISGAAMGLSGAFLTLFVRGVEGRWGMRVCFAALGAAVLVVCGTSAAVLQNPPPRAATAPKGGGLTPRQMVRTLQYRLCVAGVALGAPPVLLFSPEILPLAAERGIPESLAPLCVALGSAASAAGRLLCPAVSDRAGRRPVLCAVYAALAAGSVWFAFAQGWLFAAAYCLLTCFYSGGAAVQPALNSDLFGLPHAGVNYGLIALGMSAGSFVSYVGSQVLPLPARHLLAAVSAVAGGLCFICVKPVREVENKARRG